VFFSFVLNHCLCGYPVRWVSQLKLLIASASPGADYSHSVLLFRSSSPPGGILCVIQLFLCRPVSVHSTSLAWILPFVCRVPVSGRSFACRQFRLVFFFRQSALVILKFQFFLSVNGCRVKPEYFLSCRIKGLEVF
jgi:hypothetical protein